MLVNMQHQLARIESAATSHSATLRRGELELLPQRISWLAQRVESARLGLGDMVSLRVLQTSDAPLHLAPVTLSDLLMELMPQWKTRAPLHSFELALQGEDPQVLADIAYVAPALNVMLEAITTLAPSGGTVRVNLRPGVDDVAIQVQHVGVTLPLEEHEAIFQAFHLLSTSGEVLVHEGLGLPFARAAVAAHGGRLWAETPASGPGLALCASLPVVPSCVTAVRGTAAFASSTETLPSDPLALAPARSRPRALIADGDPRMIRYLRANLEAQQYRVAIAVSQAELQQQLELDEPDILLLDTNLLDGSGVDHLRRLHTMASAHIILLARQHNPDECALYLDAGASDYLVKPFAMEELLARLRVAMRTRDAATRSGSRDAVFQCGDMVIDFQQRAVTIGGTPVRLSKTEYKLLRVLAQHPGIVLSHDVLLERVWGPGYGNEVEFLWVYIRRLRRKIETDPSAPQRILTIAGVGYQLARG